MICALLNLGSRALSNTLVFIFALLHGTSWALKQSAATSHTHPSISVEILLHLYGYAELNHIYTSSLIGFKRIDIKTEVLTYRYCIVSRSVSVQRIVSETLRTQLHTHTSQRERDGDESPSLDSLKNEHA